MAARTSTGWRCWLSGTWDWIPFAAAVYAFGNRRRNRVKLLLWDRSGFWLLMKRLEVDRFVWPKGTAVVELTVEQLHRLLDGIDLAAMRTHLLRQYQRVG